MTEIKAAVVKVICPACEEKVLGLHEVGVCVKCFEENESE